MNSKKEKEDSVEYKKANEIMGKLEKGKGNRKMKD